MDDKTRICHYFSFLFTLVVLNVVVAVYQDSVCNLLLQLIFTPMLSHLPASIAHPGYVTSLKRMFTDDYTETQEFIL